MFVLSLNYAQLLPAGDPGTRGTILRQREAETEAATAVAAAALAALAALAAAAVVAAAGAAAAATGPLGR